MKYPTHITKCLYIGLFPLILITTGYAGIDDLRITEVDPASDQVEVTHFSDSAFTTSSALPFCHRFNYASSIPAGTSFGARESKTFTVTSLNNTSSDIWLYKNSSFSSTTSIITGISYGAGNIGRSGVADSAGIWPSASAFVPLPADGESLRLTGLDSTNPDLWESLTPQFGEFFGLTTNPFAPLIENPERIGLQLVADNLAAPIGVVDPTDGSDRLFIYEQDGFVRILRNGAVEATPFLDIEARTLSENPGFDERGLIGFALHPDFATNGLIYTHTSEEVDGTADFTLPSASAINHHGVIAEWEVSAINPDVIDPASRRELLRFEHPQFNHNGGELLFGPDGYLYISIGDGGGANDNEDGHGSVGNGQDTTTLPGSVLRIAPSRSNSANGNYGIPDDNPFVGNPAALDEIFAYGFRNPFRMSYDAVNNRILVADVGQNEIEEINVLQSGGNYGWRTKEGTFFFNQATGTIASEIPFEPVPADVIDPIAQYDHSEGLSIIGGFVYQGSLLPQFRGHYLFGDFGTSFGQPSGALLAMAPDGTLSRLNLGLNARELGGWVKGFGQDASGEIYLCTSDQLAPAGSGGKVWRLIPLFRIVDTEVNSEGNFRIEILADQDGGTAELKKSTDLIDFPESVPLTPEAPSRFEALVPTTDPKAFFRGELVPTSP